MVRLAWIQGVYFLVTGVWPILSIGTFQWITGPKVDLWLVKTVGALIAVIALTILMAARRGQVGPEVRFLAMGSAAALAAVDIIYALADRIWDIYLLDAVLEIGLVVLWGLVSRRPSNSSSLSPGTGERAGERGNGINDRSRRTSSPPPRP
jgi:hypothetical protein